MTTTPKIQGMALPCAAVETEEGIIHLIAELQDQGGESVWVVRDDSDEEPPVRHGDVRHRQGLPARQGGGFGSKFFGLWSCSPFRRSRGPLALHGPGQRCRGVVDSTSAKVTVLTPSWRMRRRAH
ncbi:MAG: hypothetical protein U0838_02570 [Chloroflexota bacterium]